jgi:hypothetical protein
MTGRRFDDESVWVPKLDDMEHCASCGLPWDQHQAGRVQRCPRIIRVAPLALEGQIKLVINRVQWEALEEAGTDMSDYVLNEPLAAQDEQEKGIP